MTFEKALEAMKQGKSVIYKGSELHYILSVFDDYIVGIVNDYRIEDAAFRSSWVLGDGWEIYEESLEESQKEHEMTVEHAIEKYNNVIRSLHILLTFYKDNDFYRPKIKDAIEALERDSEPEHKCNACHCNCSHTGTDTNLQEEMKQALSRKFFELEKYSDDESTVNCMLNIYSSIFSD